MQLPAIRQNLCLHVALLALCAPMFGAGAAPGSARSAFDAHMAAIKSPKVGDSPTQAWDFQAFLKDAFGDQFTRHTAAEQKEMVAALQKIMTDALANPAVMQGMAKADVHDVVEYKLADDRSIIAFTMDMGEGKTVPNQMEWRKIAGAWHIVDSGTNGAMLSSQLRGQYANVASSETLLTFMRDMLKPQK